MANRPPHLGTLESALYAEDLDVAEAFWSKVMGLETIGRVDGRHVFFRCGSGVLLIFNPLKTSQPPPPDARLPVPPHGTMGPGHYCLAVDAAHLDAWRDHLEAAGVMIEADFEWPQGGRSIYFRDPAGNSIEIADPRIWRR